MARRLAPLLPALDVSKADRTVLTRLAETLVTHNIEQYNTLVVTKDGVADATRWKDIRRKDGFRVYRERQATTVHGPVTPQLLMLGTVEGKLEDVMYAAVAPTDEAMKIKSACLRDGVLDSKVMHELTAPTIEDPFHHIGVKWRLYDARDYLTLDATGIAQSGRFERVGYNLSHSVAFAQVPEFGELHGIERGNMSVCALYRQKTPTTVECYIRGFFDFNSTNDVLSNMALQTIATQWLSFVRKIECARMKKLVWKMRKTCGWTPATTGGRTHSLADDLDAYIDGDGRPSAMTHKLSMALTRKPKPISRCSGCDRSFRFLRSSRHQCKACEHVVCARCSVKKAVCVLAPDQHSVLKKKRTFCNRCIADADASDALCVAREEIASVMNEEEEEDGWGDILRLSGWSVASSASYLPSAMSRHSSAASIGSRSRFGSSLEVQ